MMDEKSYLIQGQTGPFEVVIGMEVHAQVTSNAKLFSGASAAFGGEPNAHVSFVDAGFPGMLPVINAYCVEQAVKTGLGLKARVNLHSVFDRKNYFYADLPTGYQISQYKHPIIGEGEIVLDFEDGRQKTVGIERLHLEQDAGKSIHDQHPTRSYVDLNRAGVALMEIVSKPDMRSPEEAGAYLRKLRAIVRTLGTCDGNMEEGSMRCDVNVSVRRAGEPLGTRCEIKNVNSVRFVMQAIVYEARRQVEVLEAGGTIDQETRLFDAARGETRTMRSKEDAHDYRYFPDPDLLPLVLDPVWVEGLRQALPELPDARKARFVQDYALPPFEANLLSGDTEVASYYEAVAQGRDARLAASWVCGELFATLNKAGADISHSPVSAAALGELVGLIQDSTISGRTAKEVFAAMLATGKSAGVIVSEQGLHQVTDTGAIEAAIDAILAANPDKVTEYRSGKDKLFGFFVGQVMKATGGKASPAAVNEILLAKLQA
jgi:aspartyl-tRNA(Asn)/glutamyl-tRNA(Gln) amidotransferase subunit B